MFIYYEIMLFQYLSQCDEVVFMDDGRVLDQGRHSDLMNRNGHYASLIHTFLREKEIKQSEEEQEAPLHSDDAM